MVMLKTDGTLWTVGYGEDGEIGNGADLSKSSPVQVGALTTWADMSRGQFSVHGRTTGKTLFAWGRNWNGALGLGDTVNRNSPVQVGALTTWNASAGDMPSSMSGRAIKT